MKKYLLFSFSLVFINLHSFSQSINWDGDNAVGNFSFCNNWFGNSCPTSFGGFNFGNELQFSFRNNPSQITTYYDLGWNNIKSIIYMATYGQSTPLSGNGNGLNFDIKVENLSSFAQTVNIPLSGAKNGSPVIELNPVNEDLTIGGTLFNDNNKIINVYGNNAKTLKLNNYIVGNGSVNLNIKQNSKVVLNYDMASQASAFTGGANIDIGELWFEQGASLNGGTIKVGMGNSNVAKLYINDADGGTTVNNAISVPAGSANSYIGGLNTSGSNIFSGNVTLSAPVTLEAWGGGSINFSGNISGAQAVNTGRVSGSGTGTIIYSGNAKTYSGLTTVTGNSLLKINLANAILSTNDITINSSGTLQLSADQTLASIVNNGIIIIDPGVTLTVGSITGSGTITGSSTSNLIVTGTGSTLNFTSGNRILKNLTLNSGASAALGTALDITGGSTPGAVIVNSGATLTTGGNLTLKSDVNGTARVGNSAGTISGTATVERYIPARRAWKLLTAPVRNGGSVWTNWQNAGTPNGATGVNIWGPTGTNPVPGANGLNLGPNYSMKSYAPLTNTWLTVTNTTTEVLSTNVGGSTADNKSFLLFVTNPFDNLGTNILASSGSAITTLSAKGSLQQGDQTFSIPAKGVAPANQFALVGNPYASPVDFSQLMTLAGNQTAIEDRFWLYDATQATLGGYQVVYNAGGGNYLIVPGTNPSGGSAANNYVHLQSGQAVFVEPTGTGGTLTFKESYKSSPSSTPPVFLVPPRSLAVNLYNGTQMLDGSMMLYDNNYSANIVSAEDVQKIYNDGANVAIARNNKGYIIEARPDITSKDTSFLWISNIAADQTYRFSFKAERFDPAISAWLEDAFTNGRTPVNLDGTVNDISFSTTADPASRNFARFRIVYQSLSGPLAVSFTSIKATAQNTAVKVEWTVSGELNVDRYEVEYSTDGISFNQLGKVAARDNNNNTVSYSYLHITPVTGINFYRIRMIEVTGNSKYSTIAKADLNSKGNQGIAVYPNPVVNKQSTLELRNLPAGTYTFTIYNSNGQKVSQLQISHIGGTSGRPLPIEQGLSKGTYHLQVAGADKTVYTTIITIQ